MDTFSKFTALTTETAARELTIDPDTGLSQAEVEKRLSQTGHNELVSHEIRWWQILKRQFTSPFIYLLIAAAGLALILSEVIDGLMILLFVLINAGLGFYQEFRSEKAVKLLKNFIVRRSRVVRAGREQLIESRGLVPGDLVILQPGDIIPADLRLTKAENLLIDESVLTGESMAAKKSHEPLPTATGEIFAATNIGFSGTSVTSGEGRGIVIATGPSTVIGGIARLTETASHIGGFEKGIHRFSTFILRTIVVTLIIVFLANIFIKGKSADIGELIIFSIALAVSVIPEALPMVATFSLSRGALRLAKNKVVVKRLSSIEDLGSIEILCTDKTGTLTENVLTLDQTYDFRQASALAYAARCMPWLYTSQGRPTEAFDHAIQKKIFTSDIETLQRDRLITEMPFDPVRRRNTVLLAGPSGTELITRGATESILPLCSKLSASELKRVEDWIAAAGREGRRVIAVAAKKITPPSDPQIEALEHDLSFIGLVSFIDPLKESTAAAAAKAKALGVRIKILTGDSREVAGAVAHRINLIESPEAVITGEELERLPHDEQQRAVEAYAVFARVSPEQKYRIIRLLEEKHEVGFLGEGINDAPALKIANVGLVVQHASDIARETADIILLNKGLEVIVNGIQEGREVFANTLKYIRATLTSNFGNFLAVAIASLLIDFLPMLPLQILLLNLLSDFPMIAIAADTVDTDELKRPRRYQVKDVALMALILGTVSTVFDFMFFGLFYHISPAVLQTNWFIGSILTELVLLFSIRTRFRFWQATRPAPILLWLSIIAIIITVILPFTGFGRDIFQFTRPSAGHLLIILTVVVVYFVTTESVKLLYHRLLKHEESTA